MAVKVPSAGVLTGIGDAYGNHWGNLMPANKVIEDHWKRYETLVRVAVKDHEEVAAFACGRVLRRCVNPDGSFLLKVFTLKLIACDFALREAGHAAYPRLRGSIWHFQN